MIDIKNLSKSFGDHLVLDDITDHIYPGEKVVVIGPSGGGKSTFLRCLNLLERPTEGTITFEGVDIASPKTDINVMRRQMGMEKVTHLLLVTDQSKKGGQVIKTIKDVADGLIVYEKIGAVINRMVTLSLVMTGCGG